MTLYSPTTLKNILCPVLQIFLYLEVSECNTISDWPIRSCVLQIYKILEKETKNSLEMVGEYRS